MPHISLRMCSHLLASKGFLYLFPEKISNLTVQLNPSKENSHFIKSGTCINFFNRKNINLVYNMKNLDLMSKTEFSGDIDEWVSLDLKSIQNSTVLLI